MNYYAGIGSRETPPDILKLMTRIAEVMSDKGWTLYSGGAVGADRAFQKGAKGKYLVFTANDVDPSTEIGRKALDLAEQYHPNWKACSDYAKRLHARNGLIVLGPNLTAPVKGIYCWTPQGKITGGTGQALRIAKDKNIEVRNLGREEVKKKIIRMLYK